MNMTCKFFNSPQGCRRGSECPYVHRWPPDEPAGASHHGGHAQQQHLGVVGKKKEEEKATMKKKRKKMKEAQKKKAREHERWVPRPKPVPALPNEMWDKIISHCDAGSLAAVCGVCRAMRRTALPRCTSFRIQAAKRPHEEILQTFEYIRTNFPHLTSLSLVNGNLRGFSFENAKALFPENLRHLSMENSEGLDDDQVKTLSAELPRLRHLDLSNCMELTNQILRYLPTTLTILNLRGVHDINANALRLLPQLKNLEILDLQACWRLGSLYSQQNPFTSSGPYYSYFPSHPSIATYSAFANLQSLPRLHTLSLSRIYCLADNDVAVLPRRLRVLDVSFCFHITDHALSLLPASLTELYCQGCDLITVDHEDKTPSDQTDETSGSASKASPKLHDSREEEATLRSYVPPFPYQPTESARESPVSGPSSGRAVASNRRKTMKPKLRIIRGEWSLPERCCDP